MLYNLNTHAVLREWYMDGVGSYKSISIGKDVFSLFQEIKNYIVSDVQNLIDQHSEAINYSDLQAYYESFVDEDKKMPDDFGAFEIEKVLVNLINEQSVNLAKKPLASTIKGEWSRLIEFLNDDLENDYLYITIEGKIPDFSKEMIDWIKSNKEDSNVLSFREGRWINDLKLIADSKEWWKTTDTKKLRRFIDDFNEINEFA
jgi:hypothetical protein